MGLSHAFTLFFIWQGALANQLGQYSEFRGSRLQMKALELFGCKYVNYSEKCDGKYVQFYLSKGENSWEVLVTDDGINDLKYTGFDPKLPNVIVIHGYNADMNLDVLQSIRKEYLKTRNFNVWAVNYPTIVKGPCYPFAVMNVPYVGKCVSRLVQHIRNVSPSSRVHLVGFSVGAHVAGRVGRELGPNQINRISGLDPAFPLFFEGKNVLSKEDAMFVDVIHTNMFMQGHPSSLGHVDFYLNGGAFQPGCTGGVGEQSGCDHHRAPMYFAESINSQEGFWGTGCSSTIQILAHKCPFQPPFILMGENISTNATGRFFVRTASQSPFAQGYPANNSHIMTEIESEMNGLELTLVQR